MDQGFITETPLWELFVFGFLVIALSPKYYTVLLPINRSGTKDSKWQQNPHTPRVIHGAGA